ncbi:type II restriction endonuclease [Prevotella sp. kh1p2]|uniref:type II restriction endonuclease n=1 Tax=Prevotella sp. kh1p2 TaxID=1761883 RepID=UPI0008AD61B4|nr:type II restriction endonuclease [Prevotella sp. kh1p2]SES64064.1 type II restriction enzyme [Prevotella sp. kh1p2]SNU10102.1 type II restriction enzyme [Prevotellaceae bacterium KH2P17]
MKVHTEADFATFLSQLKETNLTLNSICDFGKISENVEKISIKLNQLNYLIGQQDMEAAIRKLWDENPKVFSILEILVAVRAKEKKTVITNKGQVQLLGNYANNVEGVIEFIHQTGLETVFRSKQVKNLVDYVFGVETGLDTHARKNRSGDSMENLVATLFSEAGIPYAREVNSTVYPELSVLGEDKKRFDFVITTDQTTYLTEVNFYSSSGSKLNEVARSYSDIAPKINRVPGFQFAWITDGQGWYKAKNKLEEAFYLIPRIYNLTTVHDWIMQIKQELP